MSISNNTNTTANLVENSSVVEHKLTLEDYTKNATWKKRITQSEESIWESIDVGDDNADMLPSLSPLSLIREDMKYDVSQEKWIMENGNLRREGASIEKEEDKKGGNKEIEVDSVKDAYGNEIKVEKQKVLTAC